MEIKDLDENFYDENDKNLSPVPNRKDKEEKSKKKKTVYVVIGVIAILIMIIRCTISLTE